MLIAAILLFGQCHRMHPGALLWVHTADAHLEEIGNVSCEPSKSAPPRCQPVQDSLWCCVLHATQLVECRIKVVPQLLRGLRRLVTAAGLDESTRYLLWMHWLLGQGEKGKVLSILCRGGLPGR
jgi:hypothetical protein